MLIRISLIVAIIAGLAVGTINFVQVKKIIVDTRHERDQWKGKFEDTDRKLTKTTADLKKTMATLDQTTKDLAATRKERDKAIAATDDLKKQINTVQDNLTKTEKELSDAKIDLEQYHAAFATPQQALTVAKDLKALQDHVDVVEDEKKILQRQNARLQAKLDVFVNPDKPVPLPAACVGKILVTDPKWDFVILSVGEDQGARERGELLVNRDGKLVAKVRITSVQKDRCIANVLPGWKLGEVLEGDQVIPANPAES